jgi:DNA-binding NarL/FixJ family response regulator
LQIPANNSNFKTKKLSIKVAIYEDNDALRESFTAIIQDSEEFDFLGAYSDGKHVLQHCELAKPDVIVMDIDMPYLNGIEASALVKSRFPEINILIITIYEDKEKIFEALCAGATGYILKKSSVVEIINAISEIHAGGAPMSASIARKVMDYFSKKDLPSNDYALSAREKDILKCLMNGDSYKMVAANLFISSGTVRVHINNIYKKLHVNSKSEAVIKAINEKLI